VPSSEPFEYPAAVTDFDGYDAQTYLEGGWAEAEQAVRRTDARQEAAMVRIRSLASLDSAVLDGLIGGITAREALAVRARQEHFLARAGALGFTPTETAAAVLAAQGRHPGLSPAALEAYVWQRMADGRLIPGVLTPEAAVPPSFQEILADLPGVPDPESWVADSTGIHRMGQPVVPAAGPPEPEYCLHPEERITSDLTGDGHVRSCRSCPDCEASSVALDREAFPLVPSRFPSSGQ
jgi:hypothetical protein